MTEPDEATTSSRSAGAARGRLDPPIVGTMLLLAPVIGSAASVMIALIAAYGAIRLLARQIAPVAPRAVLWTTLAFAAFFGAEALAGIVNWNGPATGREIIENMIFLGFFPFFLQMEHRRDSLLGLLLTAAPWCAFAALAVVAFQYYLLDFRPQGGAGNPAILAVTLANLYAFTVTSSFRRQSVAASLLSLAGVLAAAGAILLCATRSLWPALLIHPVLVWLVARRGNRTAWKPALVAAAMVVVAGIAFGDLIRERYEAVFAQFDAAAEGELQSSVGKRLVVWKVAGQAIAERPILGFGPDAPERLMRERSLAVGGAQVIFTHFHNFLLNEMARAGVVGTLALLAMFVVPIGFALRADRDDTAQSGLGLLVCFQTSFLLSGAAGMMLDHDILDSQFMATTAFALYLIFPQPAAVGAPVQAPVERPS